MFWSTDSSEFFCCSHGHLQDEAVVLWFYNTLATASLLILQPAIWQPKEITLKAETNKKVKLEC